MSRSIGPRWERVPGSYKPERYMGAWRMRCNKCKQISPEDYTYADAGHAIVCGKDGCDQRFYELVLPPPKVPKQQALADDTATQRILQRMQAARKLLLDALEDVARDMRRAMKYKARLSRLESAYKTSADVRSARARKAMETRKNRPQKRGIALGGKM